MTATLLRPDIVQPGESAPDISIIDCGIGNIRSVQRMCEAVDGNARIIQSPDEIATARKLILPGVGAFDAGMRALRDGGWIDALNHAVLDRRIPILGICLGMQMLCRGSEEGVLPGLGWMAADVVPIDRGEQTHLKLPHMGWNLVMATRPNALLPMDGEERRFYFVHRFRALCDSPDDVLATAHYGTEFTCAIHRDNIFGMQFHPEKSHRFGKDVMQRFLALPC
jgi:glutamine amidotransferase